MDKKSELRDLEKELSEIRHTGNYIRNLIGRLQVDLQLNSTQEATILNRIECLEGR